MSEREVVNNLLDDLQPFTEEIARVNSVDDLRMLLDSNFSSHYDKLSSYLTNSKNFNSISKEATDQQLNELKQSYIADLNNLIREARAVFQQG